LAVDGCAATYGTYYGLGRGRGSAVRPVSFLLY